MVYLKIHNLLRNGINSGLYRPTESLPAEVSLARQLNVSRNTLRKALKMLQEEGLLECRHGAGNFISQKCVHVDFLQGLKGFSEIVREEKLTAKNTILKFEMRSASPEIANALAIKFKDSVYFISRLRSVNDRPVELENSWISAKRFTDLTLEWINESLYCYFEKHCHISMLGAYLHYSPLLPSIEIAALLNIRKNMPIIKVQSQSVDSMNIPFLYSENYTNSLEYPIKMFVPRRDVAVSVNAMAATAS